MADKLWLTADNTTWTECVVFPEGEASEIEVNKEGHEWHILYPPCQWQWQLGLPFGNWYLALPVAQHKDHQGCNRAALEVVFLTQSSSARLWASKHPSFDFGYGTCNSWEVPWGCGPWKMVFPWVCSYSLMRRAPVQSWWCSQDVSGMLTNLYWEYNSPVTQAKELSKRQKQV